MPNGLQRQNAFSEYSQSQPFTELQCHICEEYEYDGDWIKIKCRCNVAPPFRYMYAHTHCLAMSGKCKICGQPYIRRKSAAAAASPSAPSQHTSQESRYSDMLLELVRQYRIHFLLTICCIFVLSSIKNSLGCITIDLLNGQDLQGLTDAEYLYLPISQAMFQGNGINDKDEHSHL